MNERKQFEYKVLKDEVERRQKKLSFYDSLIEVGVPKTKVHNFLLFEVESNYKMGGVTNLVVGDRKIKMWDNRQDYARSFKFSAKHGLIEVVFTKKDVKKYLSMCENLLGINIYTYNEKGKQTIDENKYKERLDRLYEMKEFIEERKRIVSAKNNLNYIIIHQ